MIIFFLVVTSEDKEDDPLPGCISALKVVFNDCLRLLTCNKRTDHASIAAMLEEVGWLSVNQLAAETRLIEAPYCTI